MIKKAFVLITLLSLVTFGLFAEPFQVKDNLGDAKVYDSNYKAVKNPETLSQNWIIRTFNDEVTIENSYLSIEVGQNSLLIVEGTEEANLSVYLLDGSVLTYSDTNSFVVHTPSTRYDAVKNTMLFVVSDNSVETGYVYQGSSQVYNFITTQIVTLNQNYYIDNSIFNFQPEEFVAFEPEPELEPIEVVVVAELAAEVVEEPIVEAPITEEPVVEELVAEEPTVEPTVVTVSQPVVEEAPSALTYTFNYGSFKATIEAYIGEAYITYPSYVTDDEINMAAYAAFAKYGSLLDGIYYSFEMPGLVKVTYPETYGVDEFNYAVSLLDKELPWYLAQLIGEPVVEPETPVAPVAPVAEVVEVVATVEVVEPTVEPTVEPVVEPASEPVAEPVVETTSTKTPLETVTKEAAQQKAKENKAIKFGFSVEANYGIMGDTSAEYLSFLNGRVGLFDKNLDITVSPYIYNKNFAFGLQLKVNPFNYMDAFSFTTDAGISGYVNSVMKYVSLFKIKTNSLNINVDRTSNLEFTSPVMTALDRRLDDTNRLQASGSLSLGFFKAEGFIDDLELNSHLNGKGQTLGARFSANFKYFQFGISTIANTKTGVTSPTLYPAVDLSTNFSIKDIGFKLSASAALKTGLCTITKLNDFLATVKLDANVGVFTFGAGAVYSYNTYFYNEINQSIVDVVVPYRGKSITALLDAKLNTKHFALSLACDVPVTSRSRGLFVFNTVETASGEVQDITADTFTAQADLKLGAFTFSAGATYEGLTLKLARVAKAVLKHNGIRTSIKNILDMDVFSGYALAQVEIGCVQVYGRADAARVNGTITIPVSVGAKVTL